LKASARSRRSSGSFCFGKRLPKSRRKARRDRTSTLRTRTLFTSNVVRASSSGSFRWSSFSS
jgi:hypothetical protein